MTRSCEKAAIRLSKAMDGELPWLERIQLRLHLMICSVCRRLRAQLAIQKQAVQTAAAIDGDVPRSETSAVLSETARERIRRRLDEEKNK